VLVGVHCDTSDREPCPAVVKTTRVKVRDRTFKVKAELKDLAQTPSADVSAGLKENTMNA